PRVLLPDIPRWFQEIVLRCLEVDPDARHPSAAQLAFDLAHPEQVPLTERADRARRDGRIDRARRWFRSLGAETAPVEQRPATTARDAPMVMVAIDTRQQDRDLDDALNDLVQRIVQTSPGARLACVTVMRTAREGMDSNLDESGRNRHVKIGRASCRE